jgi:phosphoribosylglycinamide formyltransferase-1
LYVVNLSTKLALGFLVSHGGSAMRAILEACADGSLPGRGLIAISNNREAPALAHAGRYGVPTRHISATTEGSAEAADRAIAEALSAAGVGLVVCSGYLRPVGPAVLARFPARVLNIHPSLLPRHGGQGMFGPHVHRAVLAAGDLVSGATVHLVDSAYDRGPVLARALVPVEDGDTAEDLAARVMAVEPDLFVATLARIAAGQIRLPPA